MLTDDTISIIFSFFPLKERIKLCKDDAREFKNEDANLILRYAVRYDRPNLIKFAMKNYANNFDRAMAEAALVGDMNKVQYFCNYGATYWTFAIEKAAQGGHKEIIEYLTEQFYKLPENTGIRFEPINAAAAGAARGGHMEIVKSFEKITQKNRVMARAARGGHLDIIEYLVENYDTRYWDWGMKEAARGGHVELVHYFINRGARYWNWGIQGAARNGNLELVKFFIEKGAREWNKCLAEAARKGSKELIDLFIEYGAKDFYNAKKNAKSKGYKDLVDFFEEKIRTENKK